MSHSISLTRLPVLDWKADMEPALTEKALQGVFDGTVDPVTAGNVVLNLLDYWVIGMTTVAQECMRMYG